MNALVGQESNMNERILNLIAASDENYTMALCVMIRSVLEYLRKGVEVNLYVLEDGIAADTKKKMESSWQPYPITTIWISPNKENILGKVQERGHAGVASTYFRFFIGDLLPQSVKSAIYLDADLIIRGDLAELLEESFDNCIVQAAPDAYAGYFHISRLTKVNFSDDILFTKSSRYFNAGLLVIDVEAWRAERIGQEALEIAVTYKDALLFHDQDVLNIVLAGRWKAIHPIWNFHELPQLMLPWEARPYTRQERKRIFLSPNVIHFVSREKPWSPICHHFYYAPLFYDFLSRTQWAGWLPPPLSWHLKLYNYFLITPHIKINWCMWRGIIHTVDREIMILLLRVLITYPWAIVSYPFWVIVTWMRDKVRRLRGLV
jgi:lipopolysaccharide biosynthesis glycosyltransferase